MGKPPYTTTDGHSFECLQEKISIEGEASKIHSRCRVCGLELANTDFAKRAYFRLPGGVWVLWRANDRPDCTLPRNQWNPPPEPKR